MASERWKRVEEWCHAALARDASERAAFLAAACGDDETLRREVETLLAHAQTADGFLAAPVGALAAEVMEPAGFRLGCFLAPVVRDTARCCRRHFVILYTAILGLPVRQGP